MSRTESGKAFIQHDQSPFENEEECPVRITSVFGFDEKEVKQKADHLIEMYNWKLHSVATLMTVTTKVYSIILWNTKSNG